MALIDKASLLMVPSVYEDGTLYNVLPSGNKAPDETGNHNGYDQTRADFTFSRGFNLTATRIGPNGLIEKGRENIFTYSQDFRDAAGWLVSNATKVSVNETDPNGNSTAANITWTAGSGRYFYKNITQGNLLTASFYIKSNGGGNKFRLFGDGANDLSQDFTATDEWQRFEFFFERGTGQGTGITNASDNSAADLLIAFGQLEAGLVATPYIETGATTATAGILENTPRIDYSSGAGALLLESQRTNKITNSEYINTTTFNYSGLVTINNNHATSPDGFKNAAKITADASSGYHQLRTSLATANGYDIVSCFVKASGYNYVQLASWANPANYVNFDLTDGSIGSVGSTPPTNYDIEDYGNGWYRIHANVQASGGGIIGIGIVTSASAGWAESFTGNGTDGLLIWGVQIEAGSHVSSYVPTYGSAATRGADSCSVTGVSDVIGQTEGTLFLDLNPLELADASRYLSIESSSGAGSGWIGIFASSPDKFRIYGDGFDVNYNGYSVGDRAKIALTYKNGVSTNIYINGVNKGSITANTTSKNYSILRLGSAIIGGVGTGEFNQCTIYPTALTDAECVTLTTL